MSGSDSNATRTVNCYVEEWQNPAHGRDLRLREKLTRRLVRILTADLSMAGFAPMANLLADSYGHKGGLVDPLDGSENVAISGAVLGESGSEIRIGLDAEISIKVNITTIGMAHPPVSVWCYIEEYHGEGRRKNVRLREKVSGRKVEMWGTEKASLAMFLSSPSFSGAVRFMPNLSEREGFDDYVLVSGTTTVNSPDSIRFADGDALAYLIGPTFDTVYRDAFRAASEESADRAHSRTARTHLYEGRYREAILSVRLAVEMACGGDGPAIKRRLSGAPAKVTTAADALYTHRKVAVHEGGTRVEQQDAERAVEAMKVVLAHVDSGRASA